MNFNYTQVNSTPMNAVKQITAPKDIEAIIQKASEQFNLPTKINPVSDSSRIWLQHKCC